MQINLEGYIKKKYLGIYKNFTEIYSNKDVWELLSNLAYLGCLVDGWEDMLDSHLQTDVQVKFKLEEPEQARMLRMNEEYSTSQADGSTHLFLPAKDRPSGELAMLGFENVSEIFYILPYLRSNFVPDIRLLTDVILVDAKSKGCTDVHFDSEANDDGSFNFAVNFRQGIYLRKQSKYQINKLLVEDIIKDLLSNRTSVSQKLAGLSIDSATRFRLVDPDFPSRCQVGKSIAGKILTMRLFDFKKAPDIDGLGFNLAAQKMLTNASMTLNGLTLVSGVFGSGKGTTLNAVGKQMEKAGNLAIASLDDPIEYLRKYNQYEYSNDKQLEELVDAFKKMDLNAVFLNEVITQTVAEAVFNLVSAGVHVLTTIHTNRVFRIMYKLKELLPTNYLSLIPFINVISYQDKFSICCPHCRRGIAKEDYASGSDEEKFLDFLELDIINQPFGCDKCEKGIITTGIKVVSEHIEFNDKIKSDLLKMELHEQFDYLKEVNKQGENLEGVIKQGLKDGEILLQEALLKLDTWR